jgi:bacteriocin-like protein
MANKKENHSTHGMKEATSTQGMASSPDKPTKTGKKGDVELTENDLKAVSGGTVRKAGENPIDY